MEAQHSTEQLVTEPSVPAVVAPRAPLAPTVADVVEIVRGPETDPEARFDTGSWGLLLIPILTGIGLCLAMLFVG